eukprot:11303280-Alexandrium_andersonii.AAC.1
MAHLRLAKRALRPHPSLYQEPHHHNVPLREGFCAFVFEHARRRSRGGPRPFGDQRRPGTASCLLPP